MDCTVDSFQRLRFADGRPLRSASGVARFGAGWLIVQDDSNHAGFFSAGQGSLRRLRIFPPTQGLDTFSEAAGTKHIKADLEAVCDLVVDGVAAVIAFGSASSEARMRAALVLAGEAEPRVRVADLSELYRAVAVVLELPLADLNIEGACCIGRTMRLFNRGNLAAQVPSASVDVDLGVLLGAFDRGGTIEGALAVVNPIRYDLGSVAGVGLAITDALSLGGGLVLLSAAAEDTPNSFDDGPVVGVALALLEDERVAALAVLPEIDGAVQKVEGLALIEAFTGGARLLAVVDADDPSTPSLELRLTIRW